jgi:hypothetical protein
MLPRRRLKPLLTDIQLEQIAPLLPPLPKSKKGGQGQANAVLAVPLKRLTEA